MPGHVGREREKGRKRVCVCSARVNMKRVGMDLCFGVCGAVK